MWERASLDPDPAAPGSTDVVHAHLLHAFPEAVAALGGDPDLLLSQAGVAGAPTYGQMIDLMELAAAALGVPDFGMRLARRQRGGMIFGPLGTAMRHSRLFGDAIDYVAGHFHAHSAAARIWVRRMEGEGAVFVGHDILADNATGKCQAIEQILLVGNDGAMDMTGGYARARRVHFRHQPASEPAAYRRYFGCDVLFGQAADGVFYADEDLACPIVDSDAEAYRAATAFIDAAFTRQRPPLLVETRAVVTRLLGTEHCTNDGVAGRLGLHARTLHRRLRAEGSSFQRVKDEVRREMMLYYLERTDFGFAHISERLGLAEQSVMTRLCNRWFAASPTAVRAAARAVG